jgi:hypothetical protein
MAEFASLKPAFFIHLDVEEPKPIYTNDAGSLTYVAVTEGYTKTLDDKYPFDAEVLFGFDNLTTTAATGDTINLACQLYLKSKVNGAGIHLSYSGVVVPSKEQGAVLTGAGAIEQGFDQGYVTNHPKAALDADAKTESWISDKNLIGRGRFLRNEKGVLSVEYYVYVLE